MSSKSTSANSEATTTAKDATSKKKMGLVRFLQLEPQTSGVSAILRRRYASEVHTQAEWKNLVSYVLNRKVK